MNEEIKKYKEIIKLQEMLSNNKIPFEFYYGIFDGYKILIHIGDDFCDAIEHKHSYGAKDDLLEIMGGLTKEENEIDSVKGHLTAEEVFKRFKYCYENNTTIYEEENAKSNINSDRLRIELDELIENLKNQIGEIIKKEIKKFGIDKIKLHRKGERR